MIDAFHSFRDFLARRFGGEITIRLPLAGMLAFVLLWSYGFCGALSFPGAPAAHWGTSAGLALLLGLLLWLHYRGTAGLLGRLTLSRRDLLAMTAFAAVLLPLSLSSLTRALWSDQIFHAQEALRHSTNLVNLAAARIPALGRASFISLAHLSNLILLLAGAGYLVLGRKLPSRAAIPLAAGLFLLLRLYHWFYFAGTPLTESYWSPHPPFRLFPLWLAGTLLPPSPFAFRFAQFAGLLLLAWAVFRLAAGRLPPVSAWLFALAAASVPVLWHVGILAEQSVWTAAAWTIFLLLFAARDRWETGDFVMISCILSAATLMRQSAFLAFAALGLLFLARAAEERRWSWKEAGLVALPALVMLPFLARSVLGGTPATYRPGESSLIPAGASAVERVVIAAKSGIVSHALVSSVTPPWLLLLPLAFLAWRRGWKGWSLAVSSVSIFAGGLYLFYSIRPILWGQGRYQAEFAAPLAILGLFSLLAYLQRKAAAARVIPFALAALFVLNAWYFLTLHRVNLPADELKRDFTGAMRKDGYRILSEHPFPTGEALREAKEAGLAGYSYLAGITYGVFPQMLAGYTVAEVDRTRWMQASLDQLFIRTFRRAPGYAADAGIIDRVPAVRAVLISDFDERPLISGLEARGWRRWKEWRDEAAGATVWGMVRGR